MSPNCCTGSWRLCAAPRAGLSCFCSARLLLAIGDARFGLLLLKLDSGLLPLIEHLQQGISRQAVNDIGGETADAAACFRRRQPSSGPPRSAYREFCMFCIRCNCTRLFIVALAILLLIVHRVHDLALE